MQTQTTPPAHEAARRHWWSPAPAPDLPPISVKRAYGEVLFVFAAFFLAGVVGGGLLLANRYQDVLADGSWALYMSQAVEVVMQIGLAIAVVLLLGQRRGVTPAVLGLTPQRLPDGRLAVSRTVRIVAWALLALILGGIINALLQTGHLPTGNNSIPEVIFGVVDSVQAGVIEEMVVLAFVVVTLRQAGRSLWEITLVALVLRGSYHIYYGPGVFGILVWAAIYYWIYLRTQQLLPLIVCHAAWDTVGFLSQRWPAVTVPAIGLVLVIWVAAPILWLIERNDRARAGMSAWNGPATGPPVSVGDRWPSGPPEARQEAWGQPSTAAAGAPAWGRATPAEAGPVAGPPVRPAGPPPGWHPDPAGYNRWRWWDGYRWTEHVSHHSDTA